MIGPDIGSFVTMAPFGEPCGFEQGAIFLSSAWLPKRSVSPGAPRVDPPPAQFVDVLAFAGCKSNFCTRQFKISPT